VEEFDYVCLTARERNIALRALRAIRAELLKPAPDLAHVMSEVDVTLAECRTGCCVRCGEWADTIMDHVCGSCADADRDEEDPF
jgi:hypothetical protein